MKKTYTIKIGELDFEFKAGTNKEFMQNLDICYVLGEGKITHEDTITIVNIK